ncbi:MAG TPA: EAL domain-containing protein [Acidimicrobiales bacterium]|nr:EAL domain-containing protein [Acidimicrobiales bacterium]
MTLLSEPQSRARVVIADDTPEVRALLRYTLDLDGRFEVVGQAADGVEAVSAVSAEKPDAVVLDLAMPVLDGLEAIGRILEASPATRIVVLSGFDARQMAEEALRRGAHAYLEKGSTFTELTTLLAELCPTWGTPAPEPAVDAEPPAPEAVEEPDREATSRIRRPADPDTDVADPCQPLRDRESMMRLARWVGMLFTIVQFTLYKPPEGVAIPFERFVPAGAVLVALLAMNLASLRISRSTNVRRLYLLGLVGVIVDAAVVLALVWLFTFDATSALWALIVIPVMEGALRAQLPGAIATWGALSAAYVVRDWWGSTAFDGPAHAFQPESITYRLGIVLLVALTTGHLARSYAMQAEKHRQARADAEHRAQLLRLVASAGRAMASLDADRLLDTVVDAALSLGFDGAEVCIYDESSSVWIGTRRRGMPEDYTEERFPIDSGVAGAVRTTRETLVVEDYSAWPGGILSCRKAGFRATVGVPIRAGDALVAALVVRSKEWFAVSPHEIECLELLAAHAGVGLSNVRLLEQIRHQAMHDALTGLPNQLLFEDRVAQALAQAGRTGGRAGLFFVDLDRFKKVNDSLGHDFGNELLKQVAGRLLGAVRKGDTVARMGGDEFTLLVSGVRREEDATVVASKVLDAFRAPFVVGDHELFMTPSVGIALYPGDGMRYETLLKHADIAMYRAKARGGNGYELYGGRSGDTAYPRLALEADLHNALDHDELRVVYQPIVDLATRRVVAVEALVRWHHRSLGVVRPDEFIPLAEEAGLVVALDTWVLREACRQTRAWVDAGLPRLRLAVNMSGRHLQHPRMAVTVIEALREHRVDPGQLELEVTESVAVAEIGDTRETLDGLRGLGVTVAIDDFGTGYSMLSRLRQFPLDTLKIDRSFVSEITSSEDDAPIVSATIAMAHSLGLQVVAEGVETEAQLEYLRRNGCDLAQGYLLSRPVDADVVAVLLDSDASLLPN